MQTQEKILNYRIEEHDGLKIVLLSLDSHVFQKEAVLATLFSFKNYFTGIITSNVSKNFEVKIVFTDHKIPENIDQLILNVHSCLIENQLRWQLDEKFGQIKQSIYRKLFGDA